eukprot:COSAG06_NODE_31240_length_524_cov_4.124706_1_plen_70_part_01
MRGGACSLEQAHEVFSPGSIWFTAPVASVLGLVARMSTMVVSDANKKHMLKFQPLVDMLLQCLILDDDNH